MCVGGCVVRSRERGRERGKQADRTDEVVGGGTGGGSLWSFVGVARPITRPGALSFAWRGIQRGYVADCLSLAPRSTSRFASRCACPARFGWVARTGAGVGPTCPDAEIVLRKGRVGDGGEAESSVPC